MHPFSQIKHNFYPYKILKYTPHSLKTLHKKVIPNSLKKQKLKKNLLKSKIFFRKKLLKKLKLVSNISNKSLFTPSTLSYPTHTNTKIYYYPQIRVFKFNSNGGSKNFLIMHKNNLSLKSNIDSNFLFLSQISLQKQTIIYHNTPLLLPLFIYNSNLPQKHFSF
jgi:hypothetical protein